MIRFSEKPTIINGLFSVTKNIIGDDRGYFERLFCLNDLKCWSNRPIAQVNRTFTSKKGTIRGLHFQNPPNVEAKFICCLSGSVTDVALDLRQNSKTYGHTFIIELDSQKHNAILIPEGVAHGFQTLSNDVEMLYFHSNFYAPDNEAGVNILDDSLSIKWKFPCTQISERDKTFPFFKNFEGRGNH